MTGQIRHSIIELTLGIQEIVAPLFGAPSFQATIGLSNIFCSFP